MKSISISSNARNTRPIAGLTIALTLLVPAILSAQSATLEVTVRATPSSGRAEKVMRHPFYLLREKLTVIEELARREVEPPSLEAFADGLEVTDGLKEWIKRTGVTNLRGEHFRRTLTNDDIMEIDEFRGAYIAANLSMLGLGFPRPKVKLSDRKKNPKKWEEKQRKYLDEVHAYVELHPESKQNTEEHLLEFNPGSEWLKLAQKYQQQVQQATLRLIHSRFLAAEAETDLEGVVRFRVSTGRYYLTNLWNQARAGDVRLRWELPLELPQAENYFITLNNANSLPRP